MTQQMISLISTGRAYERVGGPITGRRHGVARPLTVAEVEEINRRVSLGEDRSQVAAAYGVSPSTVHGVVGGRITGRRPEDVSALSPDEVRGMRELYREGVRQLDIANMFGTTQQTVSQVVRGAQHPTSGGPLVRSRARRLTSDEVRRIREAAASGTPLSDLVERHNTTLSIVSSVVSGVTYTSAPGPILDADSDS